MRETDSVVGTYWHGTDWNRSVTFPGTSVITPNAMLDGHQHAYRLLDIGVA
jgi:hypothetical protein